MSLEEGEVCVFYSVLSDDSRIEFTSYADSTLKMAFNSMPEIVRAHSFRVGILTFKILMKSFDMGLRENENGLNREMLEEIKEGLLYHDIGKAFISNDILMKPCTLTEHEMKTMKCHAAIGGMFIAKCMKSKVDKLHCCNSWKYSSQMAMFHHEKWNGKGYPYGRRGEDIPLVARACSIADVYDAMAHGRPYKEAICHELAVAEICENRDEQFDPFLVMVFEKLIVSRNDY